MSCLFQLQSCPGCKAQILRKDLEDHKSTCASIELTCEDCKLVYKRGESDNKHSENICLGEQIRQLRDQLNKIIRRSKD